MERLRREPQRPAGRNFSKNANGGDTVSFRVRNPEGYYSRSRTVYYSFAL